MGSPEFEMLLLLALLSAACTASVYAVDSVSTEGLSRISSQPPPGWRPEGGSESAPGSLAEMGQRVTPKERLLAFSISYHMGNTYSKSKAYDDAIISYSKAIEVMPSSCEAYNNLGVAYMRKGLLNRSLEALKSAVYLDPDYEQAYGNMGNVLQKLRRFNESIAAYRQAVAMEPLASKLYFNMGTAFLVTGDAAAAEEAFRNATSVDPDMGKAFNNLGNALYMQQRTDEAVESYLAAIETANPDRAAKKKSASSSAQKKSSDKQAGEDSDEDASSPPQGPSNDRGSAPPTPPPPLLVAEWYFNLGVAYEDQGKLQEAFTSFEVATEMKSDYASAYNNMGLILEQ